MDPAGQVKLPKGSVRLYRANTNTLVELAAVHLVELQRPKSEKQAYLAARGYAAFLNPSLQRPIALDNEPKAPCTPGYFDDSDTLSATYEPYFDSDDDAPSESDWQSMQAGCGRPNLAVSGEPYSEPYEELSSSFWAIDFENRHVGVAVDEKHKLFVLDPANQFGVPADGVRLYDVKANREVTESKQFMRTLWRPRDSDRAELAVRGYSAYRNRLLSRPPALDEDIEDQAGRVFELEGVWPLLVAVVQPQTGDQ